MTTNGFSWSLEASCSTCGAEERSTGPWAFCAGARERWLAQHDRHEFNLSHAISRPAAEGLESKLVRITTP